MVVRSLFPKAHVWALLAVATLPFVAGSCASLEEQEYASACCDCVVEHKCTKQTRLECGRIAAGNGQTLKVDPACENSHGCTAKCAAEGFTWKY